MSSTVFYKGRGSCNWQWRYQNLKQLRQTIAVTLSIKAAAIIHTRKYSTLQNCSYSCIIYNGDSQDSPPPQRKGGRPLTPRKFAYKVDFFQTLTSLLRI